MGGLALAPTARLVPLKEERRLTRPITARSENDPKDHFGRFYRGVDAMLHSEFERSIPHLSAAVEMQPNNALYHMALSRTHIRSRGFQGGAFRGGYLADAERHVRRAVKLAPSHPMPVGDLAHILVLKKDFEGVVQAGRRAVTLLPEHHEAWMDLGIALAEMREDRWASRAWSVAGLRDEKHQHYSEIRLGRHEDLTALLKREPDAMMRRFELANTMTRSGNYDDAFYKYTTCFEAQPDFVLAYYNMGELWHLNGRTKQAIPWLKRALKHVDTLR